MLATVGVMKDRTGQAAQRTARARRRARARGAVLVEYAFLLTAVAIPAIGLIVEGGASMLKEYKDAREQILRPFP